MKDKFKNMLNEKPAEKLLNAETEDSEIPDHEVESAAQDLMRAEKHKKNEKLMKKVHEHLGKKKDEITSIEQLKKMRNDSYKD